MLGTGVRVLSDVAAPAKFGVVDTGFAGGLGFGFARGCMKFESGGSCAFLPKLGIKEIKDIEQG